MKIKKGILKNYTKFNGLLKPCGINLQMCKFTSRKTSKNQPSTSIKKYQNKWFIVDGEKAIFKTFDSAYNKNLKNIRIINELICCELANQLGISHAKYKPAFYNEDFGLLSFNILNENQKFISLAKFLQHDFNLSSNLVDIASAIDYYQNLGYNLNKQEIILDIYKIIVFDALTLQTDRNDYNINFIYDNTFASFNVSPLFDNEYAFNGENLQHLFEIDAKRYKDILKNYSINSKFVSVDYQQHFDKNAYYNNIVNICNLAKSSPQFNNFLQNALTNLNTTKAINNVEKTGVKITEDYKKYIKLLVDKTKKLFKQELLKPKDENTTLLYEDHLK